MPGNYIKFETLHGGHELLVVGLGEFFEPRRGNIGDGQGSEAFELDNDTLALLDALDGTDSIHEITLSDANTLAGLGNEIGVFQQCHTTVVLKGVDAHEIIHLAVGDDQHTVVFTLREKVGAVVHGLKLTTSHLEIGKLLLRGMDENEAVDGRDIQLTDIPVVRLLELSAHG